MGDKIYNFFWWLAGARRDILAKHKNDHNKYFQMGLAVFMTTLMATVTGTFAINIGLVGYEEAMKGTFNPWSIFLGALWGFFIMSIDRTIVVTMQKQGNSIKEATSYQKWQNFKQEILPALPRVLIAFLIAKVVLDPFEVILYSSEISTHIVKSKRDSILKAQEEGQSKINKITELNSATTKKLEDKKIAIKKSIQDAKEQQKSLENPMSLEIEICKKEKESFNKEYNKFRAIEAEERKSGKGENYYKAVEDKREAYQKYSNKKIECNKLIEENIKKRTEQQSSINEKKEEIKKLEEELSKLSSKISNSSSLNNLIDKETNLTIAYTNAVKDGKSSYNKALEVKEKLFEDNERYKKQHIVYMLFILTIELLPIVTKILASRGSYEAEMKKITQKEANKHDKELEITLIETKSEIQEEALKHSSNFKLKETEYKKELSKKKNEPWFREG